MIDLSRLRGTRLSTRLPRVARATWAVSTSPVMLDFEIYVALVRDQARRVHAPTAAGVPSTTWARPHSACLPWADAIVPSPEDVYAALVSFVDDYDGDFPTTFFPREEARAARLRLMETHTSLGRALDTAEQLACVLPICGDEVFPAAIVLHALTRQLARYRDTRALPHLLDRGDAASRLRDGAFVDAFPAAVSRGGDPLGDAYHYWANFAVGAYTTITRDTVPVSARALRFLFAHGATLMSVIRDGVFGNTLFFGAHAGPDALGLRDGTVAASARPDARFR